MRVRPAERDELASILGILEGAMLEVDAETVADTLAGGTDGAVLVAATGEGTVVGAVVLSGRTVEAIAVRPNRRDQGIGSTLVEAAAERSDGPLLAECDGEVAPFYEALGFELARVGDDRYSGRLSAADSAPADEPQ